MISLFSWYSLCSEFISFLLLSIQIHLIMSVLLKLFQWSLKVVHLIPSPFHNSKELLLRGLEACSWNSTLSVCFNSRDQCKRLWKYSKWVALQFDRPQRPACGTSDGWSIWNQNVFWAFTVCSLTPNTVYVQSICILSKTQQRLVANLIKCGTFFTF